MDNIITKEGEEALLNYEYHSSGKSKLDKILNNYWEFVVSFVPLNVAPNVLTFTATLTFLWGYGWWQYYCTDMTSCVPSWIYYQLAICLFIYQTLDAIDGKQARRTKSSSPLGQLFDHGNDAFIFTHILITGLGSLGFGTSWPSIIVLVGGFIVFYMINWRARHEGVMNFGIFSVTEAQFLGMGIYLITGYFGCNIWNYKILNIISIKLSLQIFVVNAAIITSIIEYKNVNKYYKNANKKNKGSNIELIQMFLFVLTIICWNLNNIFSKYPIIFLWICIFTFSGLIHRLIIADVTHMNTKKVHLLLLLLPVISIASIIQYLFNINLAIDSIYFVYFILFYQMICWLLYVIRVINQICNTLQIRLFVLTKQQKNI